MNTEDATEYILSNWTSGTLKAERMCAQILDIAGYQDVRAQNPLGGPDGLKDMKCTRDGEAYVAACYFPATKKTFAQVRKKYYKDGKGVESNGVSGFCFFVNQHLTMAQETLLQSELPHARVDIFSLHTIRHYLHTTLGAPIRLEYLGIELNKEEQLAYLSATKLDVSRQLDRIERGQGAILEAVLRASAASLSQTTELGSSISSQLSSMLWSPKSDAPPVSTPPTCALDIPLLCMLHRGVLASSRVADSIRGSLREVYVVLKSQDNPDTFDPPPPEAVPELLTAWIDEWRDEYGGLQVSPRDEKIERITKFYYRLLEIHPFLDGNGRLALTILDQAGLELLGTGASSRVRDEAIAHNEALRIANSGDLGPLTDQIRRAFRETSSPSQERGGQGESVTRRIR